MERTMAPGWVGAATWMEVSSRRREIRVTSEGTTSSKACRNERTRTGEESQKRKEKEDGRWEMEEGGWTHSFRNLRKRSQISDPARIGRDEEGVVVERELNVGFLSRAVEIRGGDEAKR